mgnify:FL=1
MAEVPDPSVCIQQPPSFDCLIDWWSIACEGGDLCTLQISHGLLALLKRLNRRIKIDAVMLVTHYFQQHDTVVEWGVIVSEIFEDNNEYQCCSFKV